MAKKNAQATENGSNAPVRPNSFARLDNGYSPSDYEARLLVHIHSDLLDRYEGMTQSYEIWGAEPSRPFLTKVLVDDGVRKRVGDFFLRRTFARVIRRLFPNANATRTIVLENTVLTKSGLYEAILAEVNGNVVDAAVIMELTLPLFLRATTVSNNIQFSRHVEFPFKPVVANDLRNAISVYQIMQAVEKARGTSIDKKIRYSTETLAELIAEAYRPIGLEMLEFQDLSAVFADTITGVRAHIDPSGDRTDSPHMDGALVPPEWREHPVIQELATNMVFVRAALELPQGTSLRPTCDMHKLRSWAPIILAAIKSSEQYAWVGKAEVLRHYGCKRIRDSRGQVRSAVLYRDIKAAPFGQSVFATPDDLVPGATSIDPVRERIADTVQAAYGSARFSVAEGADMLSSILTDGIETGWTGYDALYVCDTAWRETDTATIAAMLAKSLYVAVGRDGVPQTDGSTDLFKPLWWYTVDTKELNLDILSGVHKHTEITTCDPVEVLLAVDDFDAKETTPPKPQFLGPAAFGTYVMDFDRDRWLVNTDARYAFKVAVHNTVLQGNFSTNDIATLKSTKDTKLVIPRFNRAVVDGLEMCYELAVATLDAMTAQAALEDEERRAEYWPNGFPGAELITQFKRTIARRLFRLSQDLSPDFRSRLHEAVISRTITSLKLGEKTGEAQILRAKLFRRTFGAASDMIALDFFFRMQGIDVEVFRKFMGDEEMVRTWMEEGTNRDVRPA